MLLFLNVLPFISIYFLKALNVIHRRQIKTDATICLVTAFEWGFFWKFMLSNAYLMNGMIDMYINDELYDSWLSKTFSKAGFVFFYRCFNCDVFRMKSAVALALLLCEFIVSFEANVVEEYIMSTVELHLRRLESSKVAI